MANFIGQQINLKDIVCDDRLKIDLNLDLNKHADRKKLHADLTNIRQWRKENFSVLENKPVGIDVLWKNDRQKERIFVVVTDRAFEVIGYVNSNGYISFGAGDYLKYEGRDNGNPSLNMANVYQCLNLLLQWPGGTYVHYDEHEGEPIHRMAFLVCVFLASEMVRNEVLEAIFLNTKNTFSKQWNYYRLICTKWEHTLKAIKGENVPLYNTIYLKNIWDICGFKYTSNIEYDAAVDKIKTAFNRDNFIFGDDLGKKYGDIMSRIANTVKREQELYRDIFDLI